MDKCPNPICEDGRVTTYDTIGRKRTRQCTLCLGTGVKMECSICGGHGDSIGVLGGLEHFRCRQCGSTFQYIWDMDVYARAMRDRLLEDPEAVWTG